MDHTSTTDGPGDPTAAAASQDLTLPGQPDGEQVLFHTRTHPKVLFVPAVVQLVLIGAHLATYVAWPATTGLPEADDYGQLAAHGLFVVLAVWYALIPYLRWRNSTFTVTNWRVKKQWGLLYRHSREIPLSRIVSVGVERGILDRIFRCGTLALHDAAASAQVATSGPWNQPPDGPGVRFADIPGVQHVHQLVNQARFDQTGHR